MQGQGRQKANQIKAPYFCSYPLRVDLVDIGQTLGQYITGHLISVFIPEFSCLPTGTVDAGTGVCYGSSHDAADGWRNLEDVGDRRWLNQFVLYKVSDFQLSDFQAMSADNVTRNGCVIAYRHFLL